MTEPRCLVQLCRRVCSVSLRIHWTCRGLGKRFIVFTKHAVALWFCLCVDLFKLSTLLYWSLWKILWLEFYISWLDSKPMKWKGNTMTYSRGETNTIGIKRSKQTTQVQRVWKPGVKQWPPAYISLHLFAFGCISLADTSCDFYRTFDIWILAKLHQQTFQNFVFSNFGRPLRFDDFIKKL